MTTRTDPAYHEVAYDQLRRVCNPVSFDFQSTETLTPLEGFIGQERALQGLEMGITSQDKSSHVRVIQPNGASRTSALKQEIDRLAQRLDHEAVYDWCYVYNFDDWTHPTLMRLPKGGGKPFARSLKSFGEQLLAAIKETREDEENQNTAFLIHNRVSEEAFQEFDEELRDKSAFGIQFCMGLIETPSGPAQHIVFSAQDEKQDPFLLVVDDEDQPIEKKETYTAAELQNILELYAAKYIEDESEREKFFELVNSLMRSYSKTARAATQKFETQLAALHVHFANEAFIECYQNVFEKSNEVAEVVASFMNRFREYFSKNSVDFLPQIVPGPTPGQMMPAPVQKDMMEFFTVNVIVDNSHLGERVPVIWESDPTFTNLIGSKGHVRYMPVTNGMSPEFPDHTTITAGSLLKANGGVIVIELGNLLSANGGQETWRLLINALRNQEAVIDDLVHRTGMFPGESLTPEPIPLNVRVVLIVEGYLDHQLASHPLLSKDYALFRIRAQFVPDIDRNEENEFKLAQFLHNCSSREGLSHCDPGAVARFVEYASWMAGDQDKLTLDFTQLKAVYLEAVHWARRRLADDTDADGMVIAEDIDVALRENAYRSDFIAVRLRQMIAEGTLKVDVSGEHVGRINALAVMSTGDFSFGRPTVVSAVAYMGKGQVVNVERDVEMAGPGQKKSVKVIEGYLKNRYGDVPLAVDAQIVFEQTHGPIDGDSASVAELYVLLSALSDTPLQQGIAVTGSCNQHGGVQAIGGANEKIEGFFDVCRVQGPLTGGQGVIIPASNVRNLMLRPDVVEAVKAGQFHVWAIEHVDDGILIMTGMEVDDFNTLVMQCLKEYALNAARWQGKLKKSLFSRMRALV